MSDCIRLAQARRTSRANLFISWLAGGTLRLYAGAVPSTPDTPISDQTLLAQFTGLPTGTANAGAYVMNGGVAAAMVQVTGTPDFARAVDSSGTAIGDFDVGLIGSGNAILLDHLDMAAGAIVALLDFTITEQ